MIYKKSTFLYGIIDYIKLLLYNIVKHNILEGNPMIKSIKQIKEEFENTKITNIPKLIEAYKNDNRRCRKYNQFL